MAIDTAADQKGAEHMAQPDSGPDPDRTASEVSSAADGDSTTEDLPTTGDDNSSPMENIGHNEDIPLDVASTPTHEKLQPVQECPAPVYMANPSGTTAGTKETYVPSRYVMEWDALPCPSRKTSMH